MSGVFAFVVALLAFGCIGLCVLPFWRMIDPEERDPRC